MAAGQTEAKMNPRIAQLETFLAAGAARIHLADFFQMRTGLSHGVFSEGRLYGFSQADSKMEGREVEETADCTWKLKARKRGRKGARE